MVLARKYKIALAAATALTALGATAAYKELTQRPGEAALAYVPADALAAISIDLSPGPTQVATFTQIDDALKANGFADAMQTGLTAAILPKHLAEQVAPYVQRAGAVALLPSPELSKPNPTFDKATKEIVAFLGLSDGPQVNQLLAKELQPRFLYGWTYYKVPHQNAYIAVIGNELAGSPDPWALFKTHRVQQGTLASLTQSNVVQEARASVPSDANVLFLMSPSFMTTLAKDGKHNYQNMWGAAAIVVQPDGVECTFHGFSDPANNPDIARHLASMKPLRQDLMACLPSGAYGVMAIGTPSNIANTVGENVSAKDVKDPIRKAVGLDYDADIVPALKGNAVIAAYPSGDPAAPYGVNVLAMLDDQNAADPAAAARKLEAFAEQQFNKEAKGPHGPIFADEQSNGATVYHLAGPYQKEIDKAKNGNPKKPDPTTEKLLNDKTFTWATVGNAVIVASSDELLKRALAAYQTHANTMATDPLLASYAQTAETGSQALMLLSPARIAQGVQGTIDTTGWDKDQSGLYKQVMDILTNLKAPLWANTQMSSDGRGSSTIFIPLDYEKIINLAGSQTHQSASTATDR